MGKGQESTERSGSVLMSRFFPLGTAFFVVQYTEHHYMQSKYGEFTVQNINSLNYYKPVARVSMHYRYEDYETTRPDTYDEST